MADNQTPLPNCEDVARRAYEWLKKRRSKEEISTGDAILKVTGFTWDDIGGIEKGMEFLNESGDALLRLIKKEKEYVADFSISEGMFIGQPFAIPFLFRKK